MKHALSVIALSLPLLAIAPAVQADGAPHRLELEAAIGANICLKNDRASCGGADPFLYGRIGAHYRLLRNVSVGLDIDAGAFGTERDDDSFLTLHVTGTVRGLYQITPGFRSYAGVGLGYGRLQAGYSPPIAGIKSVGIDTFAIKVPLGVKVRVISQFWLGLDAAVHVHLTGSQCTKTDGLELCDDVGSSDVIHNFHVGLLLAYHL